LVFFALAILSTLVFNQSYGITSQESKEQILTRLNAIGTADWPSIANATNSAVNGNWTNIDQFSIVFFANSTNVKDFSVSQYGNVTDIPILINGSLVNGTIVPPPEPPKCDPPNIWNGTHCVPEVPPEPPIEICGDGIDNNNNSQVDEGCPIAPPVVPDEPGVVNNTKFIRVAAVGDVDDNNGLTTQIALAKENGAQCFILAGDFDYNNGQAVVKEIQDADFDCFAIVPGNHDNAMKSLVMQVTGFSKTWGNYHFTDKLDIISIDGNDEMDCSSQQFADLKAELEGSDAWYKLVQVHQPFATVKNNHHGDNGQFSCWDPVFRGNGVDAVLGAHVHNYQRFDINGLEYLVVGTGTHDTGSNMYSIDSDNWKGFDCLKCITGTNGITIIDMQIDNPKIHNAYGWFVSNSGDVKDKFTLVN
jgi:hypothetical protein